MPFRAPRAHEEPVKPENNPRGITYPTYTECVHRNLGRLEERTFMHNGSHGIEYKCAEDGAVPVLFLNSFPRQRRSHVPRDWKTVEFWDCPGRFLEENCCFQLTTKHAGIIKKLQIISAILKFQKVFVTENQKINS